MILEFGYLCGARGSVREARGSVPYGEIECERMQSALVRLLPNLSGAHFFELSPQFRKELFESGIRV